MKRVDALEHTLRLIRDEALDAVPEDWDRKNEALSKIIDLVDAHLPAVRTEAPGD